MNEKMNHFDEEGNAIMVDVTEKKPSERVAVARGDIRVSAAVMEAIQNHEVEKGDVLGVARVAGIMAAKRTFELIPMCHPLPLTHCAVNFDLFPEQLFIRAFCTVKVTGNTGVEMEALTGVSTALLTIYDMCKAIDKTMELQDIHLMRKEGGKSGVFVNQKG